MKPKDALVKNASDTDQVEKAKLKEETRRERELNDLRFVLSHPQGRRLIWRILERTSPHRGAFVAGQSDSTAFNLGEINIGSFILSETLFADTGAYLQMMQENKGE